MTSNGNHCFKPLAGWKSFALMRGCRLPPGSVGLIALLDRTGTFLQQEVGALVFGFPELEIGGVELDRLARGCKVLLRRGELALLHLERRLVDGHLLAVIGIVEPRDQRAGLDPFALVERQFDDARLHGLEAEHAFVRLDIAGDDDEAGVAGRSEPRAHGVDRLFEPSGCSVQAAIGGQGAHHNQRRKADEQPPHDRHENR